MTHNYNNVSFDLEQLNYLEIVCKGLETSQLFLVFFVILHINSLSIALNS